MALNDKTRRDASGNGERDPGLDRVYGSAASEEPPAHLDAAILAAAHRAAGARPRPLSRLRTWRVPVSIAAVVVLSVSLVTVMREEGGGEYMMQTSPPVLRRAEPPPARAEADAGKAPARESSAAERASRADAPARRAAEAERNRAASEPQKADSGTGAELARRAEPKAFPTQPESMGERAASPAPAPGAAIGALGSSVEGVPPAPQAAAGAAAEPERPAVKAAPPAPRAMRSQRDAAVLDDAGGRGAAGPAAAPPAAERSRAPAELRAQQKRESVPADARTAALLKELEGQPPEKWLDRIQALRREGQAVEARDLLAEFKRRYPAHPLPRELQ